MKFVKRLLPLVLMSGFICSSAFASATCPGDISDNTQAGENFDVNVFDLLLLLGGWNTDAPGAEIAAPDDVVDVFDLLGLLQNWGPCVIVPGDVCADDDESGGAHCQLSDFNGQGATGVFAGFSDVNQGFLIADNLVVVTTGLLESICCYGIYFDNVNGTDCAFGAEDDFTIKLFNDDGAGVPAPSPFFTYNVGPLTHGVDKQFTGDVLGTAEFSVFEYTLAIPQGQQPLLQADTCYWVEIGNDVAATCIWGWVTAPPGDGRSMQRASTNPSYTNLDESDYDLAWCINQSLGNPIGICTSNPCFGFCPLICFDLSIGYMQSPEHFDSASTSDADVQGTLGVELAVAENFVVAGADQSISQVCWWGIFLTFNAGFSTCSIEPAGDSPFNITYYPADVNGGPDVGNPLATFPNIVPTARGTTGFNFLGPVYEWSFLHTEVPVADGATIWLEIQHVGDEPCVFLWLNSPGSADDIAYQDQGAGYMQFNNDFAFKVDVFGMAPVPPPPPPGEVCSTAIALVVNDPPVTFDTDDFDSEGTGSDPTSSCELTAGGPFDHDASAWFSFVATDTTATISLCGSTPTQDSVMTLFDSCGTLTELFCDDDFCNAPDFGAPEVAATGLTIGETYLVLVDYYLNGHAGGAINTIEVTSP